MWRDLTNNDDEPRSVTAARVFQTCSKVSLLLDTSSPSYKIGPREIRENLHSVVTLLLLPPVRPPAPPPPPPQPPLRPTSPTPALSIPLLSPPLSVARTFPSPLPNGFSHAANPFHSYLDFFFGRRLKSADAIFTDKRPSRNHARKRRVPSAPRRSGCSSCVADSLRSTTTKWRRRVKTLKDDPWTEQHRRTPKSQESYRVVQRFDPICPEIDVARASDQVKSLTRDSTLANARELNRGAHEPQQT